MIDNFEVHESIVELARESREAQIVTSEKEHFLVFPNGKIESLRAFQFADPPLKKIGNIRTDDVASFNLYFNRFADADSLIFASPAAFSFSGILDYHREAAGDPRPGGHKVSLTLQQTDEFKVWNSNNNQQKSQEDFAMFVEDHLMDICGTDPKYPSQQDMVDISRSLTATMGSEFSQSSNLQNGQRVLNYVERISGGTGPKGEIAVPEKFLLSIKVFVGQQKTLIEARLRFRINQGKLVMFYQLLGVADILRCEFDDARAGVEKGCARPVMLGAV